MLPSGRKGPALLAWRGLKATAPAGYNAGASLPRAARAWAQNAGRLAAIKARPRASAGCDWLTGCPAPGQAG